MGPERGTQAPGTCCCQTGLRPPSRRPPVSGSAAPYRPGPEDEMGPVRLDGTVCRVVRVPREHPQTRQTKSWS